MTIISRCVKISSTGGGEEMVRTYSLLAFFLLLLFLLLVFFSFHVFIVKVQELAGSASYSVKKTLI